MSVKLLTEHHFEFISLKGAAQARLSLHLSKCHIVGNNMSRITCVLTTSQWQYRTMFLLVKYIASRWPRLLSVLMQRFRCCLFTVYCHSHCVYGFCDWFLLSNKRTSCTVSLIFQPSCRGSVGWSFWFICALAAVVSVSVLCLIALWIGLWAVIVALLVIFTCASYINIL